MKKIVRIDLSWTRIMRSVEEQAGYYAAKSGDTDTTYINGLLTEPDKYHLNLYMREAMDEFDVVAEDYPHEFAEAELTLSMPMNFDDERADRLRSTLWAYVANHILIAWMAYTGTKTPNYDIKKYEEKGATLKKQLRSLLNHRKRFSRADFEQMSREPYSGAHVDVR